MKRFRPLALLAIAGLVALQAACTRRVAVEGVPGPVYTIEVMNSAASEVSVSYEAGGASTALGTVAAYATKRFVIANPLSRQVTVVAEGPDGPPVRKEVTLRSGEVVSVTL